MGNVTLPTPVFLAGGCLCLLAGYLVGSVAGPDTPERTTARVVSYDPDTSRLCLNGDATQDQESSDAEGTLCGFWRDPAGARVPVEGDDFRFVSVSNKDDSAGRPQDQVVIYGNVLR